MLTRRHLLSLAPLAIASAAPARKTLTRQQLQDKIAGGWAGQMIGVSYGAPTEFRFRNQMIPEDKLPVWKPEMVANAIDQDDLYVDMTFAKVLDDKGLDATTADFGAMFRNAEYRLWHANLAARRALKRGVPAELAGTPKYNAHFNDIDFQIEADFVGLMCPGQLQTSNDLCWRAGRVMNYGDGIYGGMFVSAMYAAGFFESDPVKLVETGLAVLPAQSLYAQTISATLAGFRAHPDDWTKTWQMLEDKWNNRELCPEGAMKPFNIDARLNGAYIAIGLLYGRGDFEQTMILATRCGQDSDCNPSSACGVLGVVLGYERIPAKFSAGIGPIRNQKFKFTDYTFDSIVASTQRRALALIERNGGTVQGDLISVALQAPKPARLEAMPDLGSPAERIAVSDPRWKFNGPWRPERDLRIATQKDAAAAIDFEGRGFVLVGPYLPDGGKADIFLDGKLAATVDVYPDEDQRKGGEAIYHAYNLRPGKHTLKLAVRGERFGDSAGTAVALQDLLVLR